MRAVIGLGNPGEKYAHTRHNAGFDVLDLLSLRLSIPIKKLKCRSLVGEGRAGDDRVVLIKPQTFMNLSGLAVADALSWYKFAPEDAIIISDDIDLPFGAVRLRPHGGAGTHNGMRNIIQCTGTEAFRRIRVGVGTPPPGWDLADFVTGHYPDEAARKIAFEAYTLAAEAAESILLQGIDKAMNLYNKRNHIEPTV